MGRFILIVLMIMTLMVMNGKSQNYTADWPSINSRPLPSWYDDIKFGIFIHWGVYSVPAFGNGTDSAFYWLAIKDPSTDGGHAQAYHNRTYGPSFTYQEFAPMFSASLFDPDEWASLFSQAGAKYVVFTTKHHEGFCMWDSAESWGWNSVDVGPHMDITGMLTKSIRKVGLKMGLYHSLLEFYNPLFLSDEATGFTQQLYPTQVLIPQLKDITNRYEPDLIWTDGEWSANYTYWNSLEFLQWLYNDSPVKESVIVNDRWGLGTRGVDGGFYTDERVDPGKLSPHKWEECDIMDNSWGFNQYQNIQNFRTTEALLQELIEVVSCGGNFLLDVGPTSTGMIPIALQDRLMGIGSWLRVNGEAIYGTSPWRVQNDTAQETVWYTSNSGNEVVYAICYNYPDNLELVLESPITTSKTQVDLIQPSLNEIPLPFKPYQKNGMVIKMPQLTQSTLPISGIFVIKLTNIN